MPIESGRPCTSVAAPLSLRVLAEIRPRSTSFRFSEFTQWCCPHASRLEHQYPAHPYVQLNPMKCVTQSKAVKHVAASRAASAPCIPVQAPKAETSPWADELKNVGIVGWIWADLLGVSVIAPTGAPRLFCRIFFRQNVRTPTPVPRPPAVQGYRAGVQVCSANPIRVTKDLCPWVG